MSESIIKGNPKGFTVLYNSAVRDESLSLETLGLFAKVCSFAADWEYSVSGLAAACGTSKHIIRKCLSELEAAGYLLREQTHAKNGQFSANTYAWQFEKPAESQPLSKKPTTVKPTTVLPSSENLTQYNKDLINTPLNPPEGEAEKRIKTVPKWKPERFEKFYAFYRGEIFPKNRIANRKRTVEQWDRLKPDDETIDDIAKALRIQIKSDLWRAGKGIPDPSQYLKDRRWEDVPQADASPVAPRYLGTKVVNGQEVDVYG